MVCTAREGSGDSEKAAAGADHTGCEPGEENGYDLCKKIREISDIPVLFLTAYKSEMDVVRGFKVGGDDYIAKPFRMQELIVRVQALLRRGKQFDGLRLVSGELTYDIGKHQVYRNQSALDLTPIELQLVQNLLMGWPYTLSRDRLFMRSGIRARPL